jgi:hypothetical protein
MFFGKRQKMLKRAESVEQLARGAPYRPIEVDGDLALHMGAFIEDAVAPEDFYELEEEVLDYFAALTGKAEKEGR